MISNEQLAFLEHYGVKGMKWGVSRPRGSNGRVSTERKQADKTLQKTRTHGKRSLTNKELADYNKRLELETKFNKLQEKTTAQKIAIAGGALVAGMALNIGKQHIQKEATARVTKFMAEQTAKKAARRSARIVADVTARRAGLPLELMP